jgi:hypothetical protein
MPHSECDADRVLVQIADVVGDHVTALPGRHSVCGDDLEVEGATLISK